MVEQGARGTFVLKKSGPADRFDMQLRDETDTPIMLCPLKQQKPMCINDLRWIRMVGGNDHYFDRQNSAKGYRYGLYARDGHELGFGTFHDDEQGMEAEIAKVKELVADAEFIDETPEEEQILARDYVAQKSAEILAAKGIEFK